MAWAAIRPPEESGTKYTRAGPAMKSASASAVKAPGVFLHSPNRVNFKQMETEIAIHQRSSAGARVGPANRCLHPHAFSAGQMVGL
jgi:hypothetical protein